MRKCALHPTFASIASMDGSNYSSATCLASGSSSTSAKATSGAGAASGSASGSGSATATATATWTASGIVPATAKEGGVEGDGSAGNRWVGCWIRGCCCNSFVRVLRKRGDCVLEMYQSSERRGRSRAPNEARYACETKTTSLSSLPILPNITMPSL